MYFLCTKKMYADRPTHIVPTIDDTSRSFSHYHHRKMQNNNNTNNNNNKSLTYHQTMYGSEEQMEKKKIENAKDAKDLEHDDVR